MKPELAQKVLIEDFRGQMDRDALQTLADLALQDGILKNKVDMDTFMPKS